MVLQPIQTFVQHNLHLPSSAVTNVQHFNAAYSLSRKHAVCNITYRANIMPQKNQAAAAQGRVILGVAHFTTSLSPFF
jgi:hypothetical protein